MCSPSFLKFVGHTCHVNDVCQRVSKNHTHTRGLGGAPDDQRAFRCLDPLDDATAQRARGQKVKASGATVVRKESHKEERSSANTKGLFYAST